jgi:hypothetical protein
MVMLRGSEIFFIYRNLRTKTWSKRNTKRRVVGHPSEIFLLDATFHVSQTVRARVIVKKRKEVHAGVRGIISLLIGGVAGEKVEVTYNPYHYESFVRVDNLEKVSSADAVYMDQNMKVWAFNPR